MYLIGHEYCIYTLLVSNLLVGGGGGGGDQLKTEMFWPNGQMATFFLHCIHSLKNA